MVKQNRDKIDKGWKEWERHEGNPFREDMVITPKSKVRRASDPNRVMLNKETGQEKAIQFSYTEVRENDEFVKIFKENVKRMFNLSRTAMKLFWYISTELTINNEIVCVEPEKALEFCEFKSSKSFYDGMSELLDRSIIARSEKDDYFFINAALFFNGNRMRIITDFTKPKIKTND